MTPRLHFPSTCSQNDENSVHVRNYALHVVAFILVTVDVFTSAVEFHVVGRPFQAVQHSPDEMTIGIRLIISKYLVIFVGHWTDNLASKQEVRKKSEM